MLVVEHLVVDKKHQEQKHKHHHHQQELHPPQPRLTTRSMVASLAIPPLTMLLTACWSVHASPYQNIIKNLIISSTVPSLTLAARMMMMMMMIMMMSGASTDMAEVSREAWKRKMNTACTTNRTTLQDATCRAWTLSIRHHPETDQHNRRRIHHAYPPHR